MQVPMEILGRLATTIVVASVFVTAVSVTDPFSQALLGLKSQLVDRSKSLQDWNVPSGGNLSETIYACSWSGITCTENSSMIVGLDLSQKHLAGALSGQHIKVLGHLLDLNLSYNSFSGRLPPEIFNLTNLRSLDISRNDFREQFPPGISAVQHLTVLDAFSNSFAGSLPVEVSQLENLKVLNLAGSYFEGPIPSEYGSFRSLEFLHLAGNLLNGEIPPELGKLQTVTHMEIGYNSYQGNIPWQLGNMSELQYLDIAAANLSGPIPSSFSNLTKLHSMFLFRNHLTGLIPQGFSNITPLASLDLSDNQISGPIPESFANLKSLRLLSLMYNTMSGSVPEAIADLPLLETLLIWNNFFSGPLPQNLGRRSKLKWVDVSTNTFNGSIPPDICAGGVLQKLMLFSNDFTGSLAPALSNCSSLVRLRVEDNFFSGQIPLKFGFLPDITYVDLSRNRLTGGIPTDIHQASKLQYFNVCQNPELAGMVPGRTWSLPHLQNFSASFCNISGDLPVFEFCGAISSIELKSNNISGTIPDSIANCHSLERIDLANNAFTGFIPEKLASIPNLRVLDLSHNDFKGSIPAKLGNSTSLTLLNMSFNDISGSIPSEKIFTLMGTSAFVGNPQLCGAPLQPCSEEIPRVAGLGFGRKRTLTWVLLLCAGVVSFMLMSVLGIFYLRRGRKSQWKMVSFDGLPRFTANDVLRSFSSIEPIETKLPSSASDCKAVLPTGITVSVKKIEWEAKNRETISEFITHLGNARHKNLIRLMGFCSNKQMAYLLYDYLPNGNLAEKMKSKREPIIRNWETKYKFLIGIARGLCYLHHHCYPAIPHGDMKTSNILFDENMEPHLAEFGLKSLEHMNKGSLSGRMSGKVSLSGTDELNSTMKEELYTDIYNFGEVLLEVLANGSQENAVRRMQNKPREAILKEIYDANEVGPTDVSIEEIKSVLEVALLCTRNRPSDRPSMEEVLKLLSGLKPQKKGTSDFKV